MSAIEPTAAQLQSLAEFLDNFAHRLVTDVFPQLASATITLADALPPMMSLFTPEFCQQVQQEAAQREWEAAQ